MKITYVPVRRKGKSRCTFPKWPICPHTSHYKQRGVTVVNEQCRLDVRTYSLSQATITELDTWFIDCINDSSLNMFNGKIDKYLRRTGYTNIYNRWTLDKSNASLLTCLLIFYKNLIKYCSVLNKRWWTGVSLWQNNNYNSRTNNDYDSRKQRNNYDISQHWLVSGPRCCCDDSYVSFIRSSRIQMFSNAHDHLWKQSRHKVHCFINPFSCVCFRTPFLGTNWQDNTVIWLT